MKYFLLAAGFMMSLSFLSTAQAARPCKTIVKACESAGVIKSHESKKMKFEHCVKPVIDGKEIAGVQVDPAVVQECKAKINAKLK